MPNHLYKHKKSLCLSRGETDATSRFKHCERGFNPRLCSRRGETMKRSEIIKSILRFQSTPLLAQRRN
ncbi:MAG: hypothetical protein ACK42A_07135, partial [Pyrinomonadaceae bacterium]